jgi:hypothetical protein
MGRDWLHKFRLHWKTIKLLKSSDPSHENPDTTAQEKLKNLLDTYVEVFEDKLGTFKSAKARITLKEDSQPQFRKSSSGPIFLTTESGGRTEETSERRYFDESRVPE